MSTNEHDQPQFKGKDLKECEQFIAAVNRRARAECKLRDDQWIADFVAVCLTEGALIWWSLLDPETQGSWRLLRQAMISRFRPRFYGKSGTEAEEFVYEIRERALNMGMHNDPHGMANFASMCFAGGALRWYTSLDPSIRGDWDSLQQAIFTQYSKGFKEDSSAPTEHRHRGRIRACKKDTSGLYYVSKITCTNPGYEGRIVLTSVITEALEVEYEPASACNGLQALTIPGDQIKGYNQPALRWSSADTTESQNFLSPCGFDSSSENESIRQGFSGPRLTMAWEISSSENEQGVRSVFAMSGPGRRFVAASGTGTNEFLVFRRAKPDFEVDVDLLFEPV